MKYYALIAVDDIFIYGSWKEAKEEGNYHFHPYYKSFDNFQSAYDWSSNQKHKNVSIVNMTVMTIETTNETFAFVNKDEANVKFVNLKQIGEFAICRKEDNIVGITGVPDTPVMLHRYSFNDGIYHEFWYGTEQNCISLKREQDDACEPGTSCTVSRFFKELYEVHIVHVPINVSKHEMSH